MPPEAPCSARQKSESENSGWYQRPLGTTQLSLLHSAAKGDRRCDSPSWLCALCQQCFILQDWTCFAPKDLRTSAALALTGASPVCMLSATWLASDLLTGVDTDTLLFLTWPRTMAFCGRDRHGDGPASSAKALTHTHQWQEACKLRQGTHSHAPVARQ